MCAFDHTENCTHLPSQIANQLKETKFAREGIMLDK